MKNPQLLTAIATGMWLMSPSIASADVSKQNQLVAQMFYPAVSDRQGLMVQGQGEATASADRAMVEFVVASEGMGVNPSGKNPSQRVGITQTTLQPIINAIVTQGVPRSNIEVNIGSSGSYSPYSSQDPYSAQLLLKVNQPSQEKIQQITKVTSSAITTNKDMVMRRMNVSYEVDNCQGLEKAAYVAAIKDAQNRANALAEAMNVKLVSTPSVMESPWASFIPSSTSSSCGSNSIFSFLSSFPFQKPYNPSEPAVVKVRKDISVTYQVEK